MLRSRRALLYVPGDDLHKVEKAAGLGADCVCLDIEDGVALNRKAEARATIADVLGDLDFGRSERLVRINPVGSGLENDDLAAVLPAHPDGIVIPKVGSPGQVQWVSAQLGRAEKVYGWEPGGIILLATIEVEGQAGSGVVKVTMTCAHEVRRVSLDDSVLSDDKEMLEDLIVLALNDATKKAEAISQQRMGGFTAGMGLPPGMKLPF